MKLYQMANFKHADCNRYATLLLEQITKGKLTEPFITSGNNHIQVIPLHHQ